MKIEFSPETHEYRVDGEVWPSTTRLMKEAGLIDDTHYTPAGADRGTEVHEAVELIERGLVPASVYSDSGYVAAWLKAKEELQIEVLVEQIEQPFAEPTFRYCGTPDLPCRMRIFDGITDCELKTGGVAKWWGIQGAAYRIGAGFKNTVFLELRADGNYRLHTGYKEEKFTSQWWSQVFVSALTRLGYDRRWA